MARILSVDDEPAMLRFIQDTLEGAGHRVVAVQNKDAALTVLERKGIDLVIADYQMPGGTGLELLEEMSERGYDVPLIMVTAYATIERAVASVRAGALDYLTKPLRPQQLELAVEQALELSRLRRENVELRERVAQMSVHREIIGASPALTRILDTIRTVASTRATVLLQGESGTGKELLARALHEMSDRNGGPFVAVNCAALPETLVESTLFGHEKGAFTGAVQQVKGAFERASRGTLLLDEISEMRLDLQAKLLRVIQEQEFERVGGTVPIRVDVRIVATTNRDLIEECEKQNFRQDLYYRLSAIPIRVPPLRERREDIPRLAQHFANRSAAELGKTIAPLPPETLAYLQELDWPGNVRELAHAVERAVILSPGPVIGPDMFDPARTGLFVGSLRPRSDTRPAQSPGSDAAPAPATVPATAGGTSSPAPASGAVAAAPSPEPGQRTRIQLDSFRIADAERLLIEHALEAAGGNRTRAAELLGISIRTLRNKLNSRSS